MFQPFAWATPVRLIITTDLPAQPAALAFDLIDGGAPSNSLVISQFETTGVLGDATTSGSVFGQLPGDVRLTDASFFSEYLQDLMLGTVASFAVDSTGNAAHPESFPDSFSLFLLDQNGQSLVSTNDPTGSNALFLLNIGEGSPIVFQGTGFSVQIESIPESSTSYMLIAGLIFMAGALRGRKDKLDEPNLHNIDPAGLPDNDIL